jgi:hypothetical protein
MVLTLMAVVLLEQIMATVVLEHMKVAKEVVELVEL